MRLYKVHYTTKQLIPFGAFEFVEAMEKHDAESMLRFLNPKAYDISASVYIETNTRGLMEGLAGPITTRQLLSFPEQAPSDRGSLRAANGERQMKTLTAHDIAGLPELFYTPVRFTPKGRHWECMGYDNDGKIHFALLTKTLRQYNVWVRPDTTVYLDT